MSKAYDGFVEAFSTEAFPMCGMDENTNTILVADVARRIGKYDEAGRWISKVLISRDANERIKSKAREIKDLIKKDNNVRSDLTCLLLTKRKGRNYSEVKNLDHTSK